MPRGIAPDGAPADADVRFEECLDVVHRIYERAYGSPADRRDDPLLVDMADKLASHRSDEWLISRCLWDQAWHVEGTTARTKQHHELFHRRLSPEEYREYDEKRKAYQSAMDSLRLCLEDADLETVVKGTPPAPGRRAVKGLGRLVHEDETGQLWEVPFRGRNPLLRGCRGVRLVRVVDVRPEPDGSYPVYWLYVPSGVETARQGVAWTFGANPDHYWPTVEA